VCPHDDGFRDGAFVAARYFVEIDESKLNVAGRTGSPNDVRFTRRWKALDDTPAG
jgi:hypothetical protein